MKRLIPFVSLLSLMISPSAFALQAACWGDFLDFMGCADSGCDYNEEFMGWAKYYCCGNLDSGCNGSGGSGSTGGPAPETCDPVTQTTPSGKFCSSGQACSRETGLDALGNICDLDNYCSSHPSDTYNCTQCNNSGLDKFGNICDLSTYCFVNPSALECRSGNPDPTGPTSGPPTIPPETLDDFNKCFKGMQDSFQDADLARLLSVYTGKCVITSSDPEYQTKLASGCLFTNESHRQVYFARGCILTPLIELAGTLAVKDAIRTLTFNQQCRDYLSGPGSTGRDSLTLLQTLFGDGKIVYDAGPNPKAYADAPPGMIRIYDTSYTNKINSDQRQAIILHEIGHLTADYNVSFIDGKSYTFNRHIVKVDNGPPDQEQRQYETTLTYDAETKTYCGVRNVRDSNMLTRFGGNFLTAGEQDSFSLGLMHDLDDLAPAPAINPPVTTVPTTTTSTTTTPETSSTTTIPQASSTTTIPHTSSTISTSTSSSTTTSTTSSTSTTTTTVPAPAPAGDRYQTVTAYVSAPGQTGSWWCSAHFGGNLGGTWKCLGVANLPNCDVTVPVGGVVSCLRYETIATIRTYIDTVPGQTGQWWCTNHFGANLGGQWDCISTSAKSCNEDVPLNTDVACGKL